MRRHIDVLMLKVAALNALAPALAGLVTVTPNPFLQLIHDYEAPQMVSAACCYWAMRPSWRDRTPARAPVRLPPVH